MRRRLPLLPATIEPSAFENFLSVREREREISHDEVLGLGLHQLRARPLLSANAKTGFSLDLPVGYTCRPTRGCAGNCYTIKPGSPMLWPKSLRHRLRNLRYFQLATVEEAVTRLTLEFRRHRARLERQHPRRKFDYLRVNGSGDLVKELLDVLNVFAAQNPDVIVWIVTRRFDLASEIVARPNIFLQLSLDATTPSKLVADAHYLVASHPRAYPSFLRTSPSDDTNGAAIVFNEKQTAGLPYVKATDCPVDAGRLALNNVRGVGGDACARCRKCFDESVLERARARSGLP